jgi:hypothetical protein
MAQVDLSQDKVKEAYSSIDTVCRALEAEHGLSDDQKKISLGIPVCICVDDRGWSTCGGECPMHPPKYLCACKGCEDCDNRVFLPKIRCERKVAHGSYCIRCMPEE